MHNGKPHFRHTLKSEKEEHLPGGRDCYHRKHPVKKQTNQKVNTQSLIFLQNQLHNSAKYFCIHASLSFSLLSPIYLFEHRFTIMASSMILSPSLKTPSLHSCRHTRVEMEQG